MSFSDHEDYVSRTDAIYSKFMGGLGGSNVPGGLLDMLAFISKGGTFSGDNTFSDGTMPEAVVPVITQPETANSSGTTSRDTSTKQNGASGLPKSEPMSRSGNNSNKGKGRDAGAPLAGVSRM